jgi:hypothetical protein
MTTSSTWAALRNPAFRKLEFAAAISRDRSFLEEEKDRLCRHPGDQQKAAGRYSQHDERSEMMIIRLPAQWAFFFHRGRLRRLAKLRQIG